MDSTEREEAQSPADPLEALGGTALRVYLYLLAAGRPVGVRELQRALGFKSPSTARHHLERLVALGLAEKDPRGYRARRPSGLLGELIPAAGKVFPRSAFITGLAIGATIAYSLVPHPDLRGLVALCSIALAVSLYTLKLYLIIRKYINK